MDCKTISLKKGSTGSQVGELQQCLKDHKYYLKGTVDNKFGPYTESELKRYQKDNGLDDDGWFAVKTCTKMNCKSTPTPVKVGPIQAKIQNGAHVTSQI